MEKITFTVTDPVGLHARPATALVNAATKQKGAELTLAFNGKEVNLKSIMGVMALGVPTGSVVEIIATGDEATVAIEAIKDAIVSLNVGKL